MNRRSLSLRARVAVAVITMAALLPITALADPASAAESSRKTVSPDKLAPLGEGKAKAIERQALGGDFAEEPTNSVLETLTPGEKPTPEVLNRRSEKRDHFDKATSKLVERTPTSDIYENADGSKSADMYGAPINFKDRNGSWQRINDQLRIDDKTKAIHNSAGPVDYALEASPTAGKIATLTAPDGKSVSFGLDRLASGKLATVTRVKGDIERDVVTYPGAIDGADLTYAVVGSRLKEAIVLNSAPVSAPTYRFPLTFNGLHAVTKHDGSISFQDEKNTDVITVDPAVMWDAKGTAERISVKMELSKDANAIVLTPDFAWLQQATYPVTIDPTYDGYQVNSSYYMDTFVHKYYSNTNYNSFYAYGVYNNQVGYDSFPNGESYTYFYQDLNALNGRQILHADWKAWVYPHSSTEAMSIYPVSPSNWSAGAMTWNNKPNHREDEILNLPTANQYTAVDMTGWIENWTDGTWQNSGLMLDTAGEDAFYRLGSIEGDADKRPYIHVTYNDWPNPGQPIAPDEGANVMTTTPTLGITTGTDPNNDPITGYWYRVSNTTNPEQGQIINSGWQSGTSWTVPAGSLIDGVTYSWYVATRDTYGFAWSAVRTFKVNLRLGAQPATPSDTHGPITVNLANGNVSTSTSSPSMETVGGDLGLTYTYNSQAQSTMGLTGKYYPGCDFNQGNVQGNGYQNFAPTAYVVRTDPTISFDWGSGSPGASIPSDGFCGVWDGFISPSKPNTYLFDVASDDGVRVWVNNQLVINRWGEGGVQTPGQPVPSNQIALYNTTVPIHVEYYEKTGLANVQVKIQEPGFAFQTIPPNWLSTTPSALPVGWQLSANTSDAQAYSRAIITDGSVVLVEPDGVKHEYKRNVANGLTGFAPPPNERATLMVVPGSNPTNYLVQGDDGNDYVFNEKGALTAVSSSVDDKAPAAATYIYAAGADTARLTAIKDPVSRRQIGLRYSSGNPNENGCPAPVTGYSPAGPAGMLCQIDYPDGSSTKFYYSASDSTGQLMRIVDPGTEVTDFSYDSVNGLLNGVSDPLQMQYRADVGADTAYTRVNYDTANRASSVLLAAPDGFDTTDVPPSTERPWHSYTYTVPFTPSGGGETRVAVGGLSPPQGFATREVFNKYAQTTQSTDSNGVTVVNVWDPADRLLSTVNNATGIQSTTTWDTVRNIAIDQYGPAPSSCFNSSYAPNGTCTSPAVPHTHNDYDEGYAGLAIAWWNNPTFSGPTVAHSTKIRSGDNDGRIQEAWPVTGPYILGQATNYSLRATGEWYARMNGTYTIVLGTGVGDTGSVWIDDKPVLTGTSGAQTGTFVASQGWHRIRIDDAHTSAATPQLTFLVRPPNDPGTNYVVQSVDLRPDYNLITTVTTDDATSGSPATVDKTNYGSVGGLFDPAYGLELSTTEDSAGQNLTTSTGYEAPRTPNRYMRQTSKTLPAGNTTTYHYPDLTPPDPAQPDVLPAPPINPCSGGSAPQQPGLMDYKTSSTPAGGSAIVEHFLYDIWGRVIAEWTNSDAPTCTYYDPRGRVTSVAYPAQGVYPVRTVTNTYDVGGNPLVSWVADAAGTVKTTVDLLGRVVSYTDVWNTTTATTYNLAGNVTDTVAPGDARHTDYDGSGRVTAQKAGDTPASLVTMAVPTYNAASEVTSVSYPSGAGNGGNGTSVTLGYDSYHRNNAITASNSGGTITSDSVTFSQSGRIVDQLIDGTDARSGGANFSYDGAGRLIDAYVPGHHLTYSFAASGGCGVNAAAGKNTNRTTMTDNGVLTATYCYDNADRLTSTTDSRYSAAIVYDSHGNTISLGGQTMAYDIADRHLKTVQGTNTVTYVRDALDRIVSRTVGSTVTRYSYQGSDDNADVITDGAGSIVDKTVTLMGGVSVDYRTTGGVTTPTWQYSNIHGDVTASVNAAGVKQGSTFFYDPFGQNLMALPDDATGNFDYGWLGNKFRATEHEGLINTIEMGARQYVPGLGRFIEVDPIDGGSANNYDYCDAEPISCFDLAGTWGFKNAKKWWKDHGRTTTMVIGVIALVATGPVGAVAAGLAVGLSAGSLAVNVSKGNWSGAAVDAVGVASFGAGRLAKPVANIAKKRAIAKSPKGVKGVAKAHKRARSAAAKKANRWSSRVKKGARVADVASFAVGTGMAYR